MNRTPEQVIEELSYRCYRHNRNLGAEAESLRKHVFPDSGAAMESRYQAESQAEAA